ncbi:MAG TPA: Hsp20/alpha crystallin family protein [Planctomycetota bacterium]|nr:Hsp20/alpha crystallin family protein [Planctomycetota bacterium]
MASESLKFLERLKKLEGQLERLANDIRMTYSFNEATCGALWRPAADVYETEREVVVRVEAPGLHAEDIVLELHTDTLVIRAVRREPQHDTKSAYHQLEIHYGYFERVVPLPRHIRHEEAEATYTEGFLIVRIPKCEHVVELAAVIQLRI